MPWQSPVPRNDAEILLVEDNPGDVRLQQEPLKEGRFPARLHVVPDGERALAFLRHQGRYHTSPTPDLILLDLNLPRMDGREVLAQIKGEKSLRRIPVLIVSTSTREEDIHVSYDLHANCYIPKPIELSGLIEMGKMIEAFWLRLAVLPARL